MTLLYFLVISTTTSASSGELYSHCDNFRTRSSDDEGTLTKHHFSQLLPGYQTATLVIMFTKWPLMKDLKRNFADTPRTQNPPQALDYLSFSLKSDAITSHVCPGEKCVAYVAMFKLINHSSPNIMLVDYNEMVDNYKAFALSELSVLKKLQNRVRCSTPKQGKLTQPTKVWDNIQIENTVKFQIETCAAQINF